MQRDGLRDSFVYTKKQLSVVEGISNEVCLPTRRSEFSLNIQVLSDLKTNDPPGDRASASVCL